jgi:FkbM family methyltransferase
MQIRLRDHALDITPGRTGAYWQGVAGGHWEPATFRIFERFIDREHCYIDMGAYVGVTLLYGCQIARRAYGIEPDPIAFAELQHNVAANRPLTDNVELLEACIAPRSGTVAFGNCGEGGDSVSSLLFADRRTHWMVKALSFEDFVSQHGISDCNFIKMDIEGGEYTLLPSMRRYLRTHRPTLHLSLHPCHLGKRRIGWIGKVIARVVATLRIRSCLQLYRHLYDHDGRPMSFARLLWLCRRKITLDVVLTDIDWDAA